MGSLRKAIASVSLFALIFTITGFSTIARAFVDVPSGAYYESALEWAVAEGVVDDASNFRPGDDMNRAEMARMVTAALGVAMDTSAGPSFVDVAEGQWYYPYVETGVANGLFIGYTDADGLPTGNYGPGDKATRGAVVKVLMLAYGFDMMECDSTFSDVDYSAWYGPYMDSACYYGIVTQGRPGERVNRAEFVTMLSRAANYEAEEVVIDEDVEDIDEEEEVVLPASEGTLTVAVAPSTAMPATIPADAASIDYATFAFTATGDDVAVNGMTMWRDGLGSHEDFSEVWVSVDGFKVGSERSINSDQNAVLNLSRDYIVVPAGETVLVDLKASMGSAVGANRSNRLGFRSAADIDTNAASVSGSFPTYGNYMTTSSYTVGSAIFSNDGSATTVDVGDVQVIVGEFQVENSSTTNEDFVLANVDFEINGTGSYDSLANAQLYYLGEVVSDSLTPFDDHLRFTWNDGGFLLEDGDTEDFEVKADVVKGDDADTIQLQLDEDNDLTTYVANTDYNYAVNVNRTSPTTGLLSIYTINAGTITFARHASSPSSTEITNDIDGVTFLVAQVTIGEDVKMKETRVYLDGTFTTGTDGTTAITTAQCSTEATFIAVLDDKIDDVKVWDGSRLVAGGQTTLADFGTPTLASGTCTIADAYYSFTDNYDLAAGTHLLSVTADVSQYMAADETASLSLDNAPSGWISAEYIVSGDDVVAGDVNGSASGSTFTIESSTLTLSRQDGFATDEDIVKGSQDIVLLTFKLENNDAGDARVTDMDIQDGSTLDADGTLITGIGIYESGTNELIVNSLQDLGSDDIAQFDGLSYVVPSGGFVLLDVRGTLSTSWAVASDLDLFVTGLGAKDVNNNDATITYPDCTAASCTTLNALAFASFDVNDSAQVTLAFDYRNDADYTELQTPTGTCSDGSCAVTVAQLEFHAIFDDVLLKRLVLSNDDNSSTYNQRFGTFFLVDAQTGDIITTGSMSDAGSTADGTITFSGFTYEIPRDEYFNVNVLAQIQNINQASQTGAFALLYMADPTATTGTSIELVSDATGSNIAVTDTGVFTNSADDGDTAQQQHIARRSIPEVTYNNDNIATSISGTVTNKEVYKFTIVANDAGDIEWEHVTFDVTETAGMVSSAYKLYVSGQSTALNTTAVSVASGEVEITPDNVQSIQAGAQTTYVLKATLTISSATTSQTLSIELTAQDDTALTSAAVATLNGATACNSTTCDFVWSDKAAQSHGVTTTDWTTGYQVDSFDVETVNIGYQGTG